MQRDEEDRLVPLHERLGAVAVVHVPVDDRDPLQAELGLGVARGDDDVAEDAEAHRAVLEGVVPWWPDEREAAELDRPDRAAGRKPRRLVGRGLTDRVPVEPALVLDRLDPVDVRGVVHAFDGSARGPSTLDLGPECHEQVAQPLLGLGMPVVPGRVQVRHRRMADEIHR